MNIYFEIERLINFAIKKNLATNSDINYLRNKYLFLLQLDNYDFSFDSKQLEQIATENLEYPDELLNNIYNYCSNSQITTLGPYKEIVIANLMDVLLPLPNIIRSEFDNITKQNGIVSALEYYYNLSINSNYIKLQDLTKNNKWINSTSYGDFEITINLAKPEKDPKQIALIKKSISSSYPKCLLCSENEGFSGNYNHPSRTNLRIIPVTLNNENWFFQFSPYQYFNEHSIIFSASHRDMLISDNTFKALLDFVDIFPHYIIGANADIPIVGGSILNHDHFQAGNYTFPLEKAKSTHSISWDNYPSITGKILHWPLSVISLTGNRNEILNLTNTIFNCWLDYSDSSHEIISHSDERHNAINPIVRKNSNNSYTMYIILRNNRTNETYPDGIFHPHRHLHHIKKENIGLIEAMGLAILPGRLQNEIKAIKNIILSLSLNEIESISNTNNIFKHKNWLKELINSDQINEQNFEQIIKLGITQKFVEVLMCCGVFNNCNDSFIKFVQKTNGKIINLN